MFAAPDRNISSNERRKGNKMLKNLLSNRIEYMYCINCQHDDMILEDVSGKKFHVYFQTFHGKAKPIECLGPFAYSEPPSKTEEMTVLYSNMSEEIDRQYFSEVLEPREQAEETDIQQLAKQIEIYLSAEEQRIDYAKYSFSFRLGNQAETNYPPRNFRSI
jgi:hypothetical protein